MRNYSESLFARTIGPVICLSLAFPAPLRANDRAGRPTVVHGEANFNRDGDNLTVVTDSCRARQLL